MNINEYQTAIQHTNNHMILEEDYFIEANKF